jgi:TonB family protein
MPDEVLHSVLKGRPEQETLTANQRFKGSYRFFVATAILASVAVHFVAFEFFPKMQAADLGFVADELAAIELPPEVRIPPPPEAIIRPARPRVSASILDEDITIAATTFAENPAAELAPPPPDVEVDPSEQPVYVDRDIEPRLLNGPEMLRLLAKLYPRLLKEAGIGGEVQMWVWVDAQGNPSRAQINRSSGYVQFDDTALAIVERMEFSPAMLRDKSIGVWIAQPISFSVDR